MSWCQSGANHPHRQHNPRPVSNAWQWPHLTPSDHRSSSPLNLAIHTKQQQNGKSQLEILQQMRMTGYHYNVRPGVRHSNNISGHRGHNVTRPSHTQLWTNIIQYSSLLWRYWLSTQAEHLCKQFAISQHKYRGFYCWFYLFSWNILSFTVFMSNLINCQSSL